MQRIIFLLENLTCQYDIDKRRPIELINRGYNVSIWSVSHLIFGDKAKDLQNGNGDIYIFKTRNELKCLLKENASAIFIDYLGGMSPEKAWIRAQMAKKKCKYFCVYSGAIPIYIGKRTSNSNALKALIKEMGILEYGKYFCRNRLIRLKKKIDSIWVEKYLPKALFLSAKADLRNVPKEFKSVPVFYTHSYDYEEYLKNGITDKKTAGQYILFVDTAVTHHPEYSYRGDHVFETKESVEQYYDDMCHFFDIVEKKYKCEVIIAAHPRSSFKGDEFQGRKIVLGKTQSLIAEADLILTGPSMSIAFMAIYQKPFVLVSTEELKEVPQLRNFRKAMENFFQTKCVWVERIDNINWEDYIVTDTDLFEKYKDNFAIEKNVDPQKGMWDIILNVVEGGL